MKDEKILLRNQLSKSYKYFKKTGTELEYTISKFPPSIKHLIFVECQENPREILTWQPLRSKRPLLAFYTQHNLFWLFWPFSDPRLCKCTREVFCSWGVIIKGKTDKPDFNIKGIGVFEVKAYEAIKSFGGQRELNAINRSIPKWWNDITVEV